MPQTQHSEDHIDPNIDVEAGRTPKMNKFAHELSDWLMCATVIFLVVYGVLYLYYEIAIGMAHIAWVFYAFLIICVVDVAAYFLARWAVSGTVFKCILILATILFCCTTLVNLLAPASVLVSYELALEYPSTGVAGSSNASLGIQNHSQTEPDLTAPQDCNKDHSGWKCGTVVSIRTALWCMYILLIPKPLLLFALISVLKKPAKKRMPTAH